MRKVIFWIVAGVIILAVLVAVPLLFSRFFLGGIGGQLVQRGGFGGRFPMMGFYGSPFFPFGMILGWLFPLGLVALVIIAAIAIGRSLGRSNTSVQATVTQVPPAITPVNQPPARTCAHCGKPAQADWMTCPYCGSPLS